MKSFTKHSLYILAILRLLVPAFGLAPVSISKIDKSDKFINNLRKSLDRMERIKNQPAKKEKFTESETSKIIRRMQAESKKRWQENFHKHKKVLEQLGIKVDNETLFSNKINGVYITDFFKYYREGLFEEIVDVYLQMYKYQAKNTYRHKISYRYTMVNKAMRDFIPHFQKLADTYFQGDAKNKFIQILDYSTKQLKKDKDHKKRLRQRLVYWATEMEYLRDNKIIPDLKEVRFIDLRIFPVTKNGDIDIDALKDWIFSKQRIKKTRQSNSWPGSRWFQYLHRDQLKSLSEILGVNEKQSIPEEPKQLNLFADLNAAA